jgi:hypothetical protein
MPGEVASPFDVDAWFAEQMAKPENVNPCVKLHGLGPEGQRCKACAHLFSHWTARRFYKCDLRKYTHGPGTDHRANWPACGRFTLKTSESSVGLVSEVSKR